MPKFSQTSADRLASCDPRLRALLDVAIGHYDFTILEGHRSLARQQQLLAEGKTKVTRSKHNADPSLAVDIAPWIPGRGVPWPDREASPKTYQKDYWQFIHLAGFVQGIAVTMGIPIRWGGDWDRDHDLADQSFDDLVHFEVQED